MDLSAFLDNEIAQEAVQKNLETSRKRDNSSLLIPMWSLWQPIEMRNVLVHGYYQPDRSDDRLEDHQHDPSQVQRANPRSDHRGQGRRLRRKRLTSSHPKTAQPASWTPPSLPHSALPYPQAHTKPQATSAGVPMDDMTQQHGIKVATSLARFVEEEAIPGTGVDQAAFWQGFDALVHDLAPKEPRAARRTRPPADRAGQLASQQPRPRARSARVSQVSGRHRLYRGRARAGPRDDRQYRYREIAEQAGPQLVVPPVESALCAQPANARWTVSTTRCTEPTPSTKRTVPNAPRSSNPKRGAKVIAYARAFLDDNARLACGRHEVRRRTRSIARHTEGRQERPVES